jgi:diamine N-acetyltransferase
VIRAATLADAAAVFALLRGLAEYEDLLGEFHATEDGMRAMLEDGTAHALLAEHEGAAVGLALYYRTALTFAGRSGLWLEDLFVLPAHRGQGIGRALLREMARITIAGNHAALEWNVLDWNTPAIALYRAIGAAPREGWTDQRLQGAALHALAEEKAHG